MALASSVAFLALGRTRVFLMSRLAGITVFKCRRLPRQDDEDRGSMCGASVISHAVRTAITDRVRPAGRIDVLLKNSLAAEMSFPTTNCRPDCGLTLRNTVEFTEMARVVKDRIAGRRVAFFTNPGNLGDALIEAGAQAFLDANGIAYRMHNSRQLRELHAKHYKLAYTKNRGLEILSAGFYKKYLVSLRDILREYDVAIICGSGGFARQAYVAMQIQELCSDCFANVIVLPSSYSITPRASYKRYSSPAISSRA